MCEFHANEKMVINTLINNHLQHLINKVRILKYLGANRFI